MNDRGGRATAVASGLLLIDVALLAVVLMWACTFTLFKMALASAEVRPLSR